MGTTAEKINRLTQTKSDLKTVINYAGGNIVDETVFKDYPKKLQKAYIDILNNGTDDLYDALPKTTEEGTSVDLDTEQGKMKSVLKSNTYQEITTGKNLFKITTTTDGGLTSSILSDGALYFSGKATRTYANIVGNTTVDIPAGTYVLSINKELSLRLTVRCYYEDNTYINCAIYPGYTSKQITFNSKIVKYYCYLSNSLVVDNNYEDILYIQLESGTEATTFEKYTNGASPSPEYPQDIHVITGDNIVKIQNKNLLNSSTLIDGYVNSTGTYTSTHTKGEMRSDFIKVKPNTDYIFKIIETSSSYDNWFGVGEYSSNSTSSFVKRDTMTTTTQNYIQIKTSAITNYIIVSARNLASATKIQLEYGTTATDYIPHQEQNYSITLGSLEYCNIGEYANQIFKNTIDSEFYDSTLLENEWYLKKNVGKIDSYNGETITTPYISTTGGLNTGATVYYVLATPTYIHISENDYPTLKGELEDIYNNAKSYDNITIINQTNDDLPFNLDISALAKIE